MYEGDDSGVAGYKKSEFNPASYKMIRIHKAFDTISQFDLNLKAYNQEFQDYNFNLKFSLCDSMYQECESKLIPKEKKDVESMRAALLFFLDNNKVWIVKKDKVYPYKSKKILDENVFKVVRHWLSKYESKCRELLDLHGMDTRYGDDDEGL